MVVNAPKGSRPATRAVLIDELDRILYLHARDTGSGRKFWVMPGGGLESGKTFESAAVRETFEETGLSIELGPRVWTRHHIYEWSGKTHDQFEVFFVAHVSGVEINPREPADYIVGHRWWSLEDLENSDEMFSPTRVAVLLPSILNGEYAEEPIDCGI